MKKSEEKALLIQGKNSLYDRLTAELKHADDEGAVEQFLDAEAIVDQYLYAINEQSMDWPDRQGLAYACTHILVTTKTMTQCDWDFLGRLNSVMLGISMIAIAPQIKDMKDRAIAGLEKMAASERKISQLHGVNQPLENDMPF